MRGIVHSVINSSQLPKAHVPLTVQLNSQLFHASDPRDSVCASSATMSKQDFTAGTKSLVYLTPLVSLLLFAGNFLWLAKLQTAVNDLSRENTEILRTIGLPSDVSIPESEPDRIKRQSDLGFGDLFSQIAVKQVWQGEQLN